MTLSIELNASEQSRLSAAAKRKGLAPEELARQLVTNQLEPVGFEPPAEDPTLALFRKWEEEDAARTPEEAAQENEMWDQFLININETRAALGMRLL